MRPKLDVSVTGFRPRWCDPDGNQMRFGVGQSRAFFEHAAQGGGRFDGVVGGKNDQRGLRIDGGKFNLTASGSSDVTINMDWGPGGPASLSQDETVTGQWTFSAAQVGLIVANNASVSGILEVTGAASSSKLFGSGLTSCSNASQKLLYNNVTGLFSCGTDAAGGAIAEGTTTIVANPHDLHFDAGAFNITASGGIDAIIKLDYVNGPASRSIAQTITGAWNFTGGVSVSTNPFEVGSNVLYVNPLTARVGINTQNLSEALEIVGNASVSGNIYAANIGIGTSTPGAGSRWAARS